MEEEKLEPVVVTLKKNNPWIFFHAPEMFSMTDVGWSVLPGESVKDDQKDDQNGSCDYATEA